MMSVGSYDGAPLSPIAHKNAQGPPGTAAAHLLHEGLQRGLEAQHELVEQRDDVTQVLLPCARMHQGLRAGGQGSGLRTMGGVQGMVIVRKKSAAHNIDDLRRL